MILPCIENKCLKYPTCKHKKFIICTPLREYCDEATQTTKFEYSQDIWDILYSTFPNLLGVQLDQAPKGSGITNVKDMIVNRRRIPMEVIKSMTWEPKK